LDVSSFNFCDKSCALLPPLAIYPSSNHHAIIIYHLNSSIDRVEVKKEARSSKVWKLLEEGLKNHRPGD